MASSKSLLKFDRSKPSSSSSTKKKPTDDKKLPNKNEAESKNDKQKNNYKLDDFELRETLGTGTFGRVVLCRHIDSGEYYALKVLIIKEVIRLKQIEHVLQEKEILSSISHPFIVNMFWTHHTDSFLYMLLEYVPGGELFSYLRNVGKFKTEIAQFYAAEIISALDYLHSLMIVYRDLKPENLLLDRTGHLKLADFGFAKRLVDRTWTLCGTPEYLAPGIDFALQQKGHNKAVDWWALGILLFEMLVGYPPFFDESPFGIYEKILSSKIDWPKHLDTVAKDLIKKLLVPDRTRRLGSMKNGADDVRRHRWFKAMNWSDVNPKKLTPPIVPSVRNPGDTSCFDDYPDDNWQSAPSVSAAELLHFESF